jgi:hypothetical protein
MSDKTGLYYEKALELLHGDIEYYLDWLGYTSDTEADKKYMRELKDSIAIRMNDILKLDRGTEE